MIRTLQFGLLGVQAGQLKLDDMVWPLTRRRRHARSGQCRQAGELLLARAGPGPGDRNRPTCIKFLRIQAVLDYSELEPGIKASNAIRKAAADLNLASTYQARVRLTGPVPMNDEEFATIKDNAVLNAVLTIAVVLFILWMALRWWRIIFAVFVSLAVGLSITAALGLLMVGSLNLISVYFAVLFVGLGVDFGLQFSVRYRAERHEVDGLVRGADACRPPRRRAADAGGARHRGWLSVVPADGLSRDCPSSD